MLIRQGGGLEMMGGDLMRAAESWKSDMYGVYFQQLGRRFFLNR